MATDANIFVGHGHVGLSNRSCRVFNQVADGQFDQTVQPSEEVVTDPVGPFPMRGNTVEYLLAAFLLFNLLSFFAYKVLAARSHESVWLQSLPQHLEHVPANDPVRRA